MLGAVVYFCIEKYVCVDYVCLQREATLLSLHKGFKGASFDKLSRIGISETLLNIVSYYSYIQDENSTMILTFRIKLVSYHLPKGFVTIKKNLKP